MFDKSIKLSLITVILWAISDTFIRYSVSTLDSNPILFTFIAQISAALVLLIIAGRGPLGLETLKYFRTWTHGLFSVLTTLSFVFGVSYVTATEGTLLGRFDIILGLILPWILLSRQPSKHDLLGMIVIAVGLALVVYNLDEEVRLYAVIAFSLNALFATLRTIDVELHPTSIQASTNVKDRCRVSGVIMLSMAGLFLIIYVLNSTITSLYYSDISDDSLWSSVFPPLSLIFTKVTILSALVTGMLSLAPAMYFYTYSAIEAKTEKFLMVGCLLPVFTYLVEMFFSSLDMLDLGTINYADILAGALIIMGSVYMVIKRRS